ncbi:MAG: alpha-amylase [Rhodothermia bacterium]|nr:alpha-amylase [Rhodothermia bacterium]
MRTGQIVFRVAVIACLSVLALGEAWSQPFSWDNAIVYWVMIDRFHNGDPSNDHSYGRGVGPGGTPIHADSPGRFFGGDLKGLTDKVEEGYFSRLGVNAIWISSPLEQVHGWVGGPEGAYPSYGYHGYWPLDFTSIDANYGTESDFASFVQACHERGIRVVMDVVINHAGYNTLADMSKFGFGAIRDSSWQSWSPGPGENWHGYHDRFIDYSDTSAWGQWWGPHWVRADLAGYDRCGEDDRTTCTSSLPDFKTESTQTATIPEFLVRKWSRKTRGRIPVETDTADALAAGSVAASPLTNGIPTSTSSIDPVESLGSARSRASPGNRDWARDAAAAPSEHLIRWLTHWVRTYGIDGFRLDTARNLDLPTISSLKKAGISALRAWKNENPDQSADDLDFWMTGEIFGHGVERSPYFDAGLNSVINFSLQPDLEKGTDVDSLYRTYSERINSHSDFNVLSYISSHDTKLFARDRLFEAATFFLLTPGTVQIFYGDETGRRPGPPDAIGTDRTRSPMNWGTIDDELLAHWQKLGLFRARHPAIAAGAHETLATEPYVFTRSLHAGAWQDDVVVVIGANGKTSVNVSTVFPDNTILRDAYSGRTTFVSYGIVYVNAAEGLPVLLEEVK